MSICSYHIYQFFGSVFSLLQGSFVHYNQSAGCTTVDKNFDAVQSTVATAAPPFALLLASLGLTPIDKNLFVAEVNDPSNLTRSHMPPRHQQSFFPLLVGSLTFLSLRLSSRLYYTLTTYNICKVYLFTFQILLIALSSLRRTLLSILNEGRFFFFKELTRSPTYMVNWHHCAGSEPQRTDRIKLII